LEVPRYRQVDQEQRLLAAAGALDLLAGEHEAHRARRGDDDVGAAELLLDAFERERLAAEPPGELGGAIGRAVRYPRDPRPAREQVPRGLLADLAGADHEDLAPVELAEDLLRKRRGGRGNRRGRLRDRGLRAYLLAHVERLAE